MELINYWNDGAPFMADPGSNDPGQMGYWNDGAPSVIFGQTPNILSVIEVQWSAIGRILEVDRDNILKLAEVETYL